MSEFARNTDPDTSHEAAANMNVERMVVAAGRFVVENDRFDGYTELEVVDKIGHLLGVSPHHRLTDARGRGWIEWATDEDGKFIKRRGRGKTPMRASRATPKGLEHFS